VNGNVVIAHGASSPTAIKNMINLCQQIVTSKVTEKIKEALI
jgi:glycerol-3-phosphate acyltransferase PlsX